MLSTIKIDALESLDEIESTQTPGENSCDVVTHSGQPTLKQIKEWDDNGTYITLNYKNYSSKKLIQITDVINRVNYFGSQDDALVWMNTLKHGIYVREIQSYTYPIKRDLIISDEQKADRTEVIAIHVGDYKIKLNKQILSDRSVYFRNMLKHGMRESIDQAIDLTHSLNRNQFLIFLKFLDKRYEAIHSMNTLRTITSSFSDELDLLAIAQMVCDEEMMERALILIHEGINSSLINEAIQNQENPLIFNWLRCLQKYQDKYHLLDLDFLRDSFCSVLTGAKSLQFEAEHLAAITQIQWTHDDLYLKSSHCYNHQPGNPTHPQIYAHKVIEVLASKKIIKIKDFPESKNNYQWSCRVVDPAGLININPVELKREIIEASNIISEIAGYPCNYLHLYPVPDGSDYEILQEIGLIEAKFYGFNVQINNFHIEKLRSVKFQKLNLQELKLQHEQGILVFEFPEISGQMQEKTLDTIPPLSSSRHTLLSNVTTLNAQENPSDIGYLGFRRGFLRGQRF